MPDYDTTDTSKNELRIDFHNDDGEILRFIRILDPDPDLALHNLEAWAAHHHRRRQDDFNLWLQEEAERVLTEHFTRLANTPPEV